MCCDGDLDDVDIEMGEHYEFDEYRFMGTSALDFGAARDPRMPGFLTRRTNPTQKRKTLEIWLSPCTSTVRGVRLSLVNDCYSSVLLRYAELNFWFFVDRLC